MIANYTALNFVMPLQIEGQTQFIKIDNVIKRNLCGQFCAAFVVDVRVQGLISWWRTTSTYAELVTTGDKTTGLYALQTMLDKFGIS